ncbi:MAG: hypothetical protein FWG64_11000 [Firmicutes bacterium]|nr:hypothetical protein [Bacillota bacterium]
MQEKNIAIFLFFIFILTASFAISNFAEEVEVVQSQNFSSSTGERIYPDFWGGFYIDEFGILVILLVDIEDSEFDVHEFMTISRNARLVEFSYNELQATMRQLERIARTDVARDRLLALANGFSFDIVQNRIVVHLIEYTPQQEELFRATVFDSPMLLFVESDIAVEPA